MLIVRTRCAHAARSCAGDRAHAEAQKLLKLDWHGGGDARFSTMLLSVNQAARRLGVSPVTVRRWTATGLLPCTRTAGGHRRIDERDLDDLARSLGAGSQLAAQAAREREVEVLIDTSIALAGRLDLGELLHEIAMRMTGLLDCHFCAISDFDPRPAAW